MAKGSKSFSLAALLFDSERRRAARHLYAWCRHCDDAVDSASSRERAARELDDLVLKTSQGVYGATVERTFEAFGTLCRDYAIPERYAHELLEGMRMDVENARYHSEEDLLLYCYRVAGVVGLMMVHVMGVSSEKALRPALATGLAMQMTNIARDVREDYELGRVYIPASWFGAAGAPDPARDAFDPARFTEVVKKLLALADSLYAEGKAGLEYLPARAAFAIAAAQTVYREIGIRVLARGVHAWDDRTFVSLSNKIWLLAKASVKTVSVLLRRRRWQRAAQLREVPPHEAFQFAIG